MSSSLEEENARLRAEQKTLRAQFEELLQISQIFHRSYRLLNLGMNCC